MFLKETTAFCESTFSNSRRQLAAPRCSSICPDISPTCCSRAIEQICSTHHPLSSRGETPTQTFFERQTLRSDTHAQSIVTHRLSINKEPSRIRLIADLLEIIKALF